MEIVLRGFHLISGYRNLCRSIGKLLSSSIAKYVPFMVSTFFIYEVQKAISFSTTGNFVSLNHPGELRELMIVCASSLAISVISVACSCFNQNENSRYKRHNFLINASIVVSFVMSTTLLLLIPDSDHITSDNTGMAIIFVQGVTLFSYIVTWSIFVDKNIRSVMTPSGVNIADSNQKSLCYKLKKSIEYIVRTLNGLVACASSGTLCCGCILAFATLAAFGGAIKFAGVGPFLEIDRFFLIEMLGFAGPMVIVVVAYKACKTYKARRLEENQRQQLLNLIINQQEPIHYYGLMPESNEEEDANENEDADENEDARDRNFAITL